MNDSAPGLPPDPASNDAYALFQRGQALLADRHWQQAVVSLEKAKRLEPDKTSIREALGRAYFHSGGYSHAAREFSAVVERNAGERLRALLPGPLAPEAGRPACGTAAPEARLRHAARPQKTTGCISIGCEPPRR